MKNKIAISVIIFLCFALAGIFLFFKLNQTAQNIPQANNSAQPINQELIGIAEELSQKEGINLDKYQDPEIKYDANEKQWQFYYEVKPPVYPGGCFEILIDENTKVARILYCE